MGKFQSKLPSGKTVVLQELTVDQVDQMASSAASQAITKLGPEARAAEVQTAAAVLDTKLRRRACLLQVGKKTLADHASADLIGALTTKEVAIVDAAIRHMHDVTAEEVAAFLGNMVPVK